MKGKKRHTEEAAIRKLDKGWSDAAQAKKLNRVKEFYAKNGSVVWPEMTAAHGRPAVVARWKAAFKSTPNLYLRFEPTHIEVSESGDMASDFGVVYFKKGAKPSDTVNVAKYLVVWQKQKGEWKVLYDCWNTNGANNPVNPIKPAKSKKSAKPKKK